MTLMQIKRQEMDSQVGAPSLSLVNLLPMMSTQILLTWRDSTERDLGEMDTRVRISPGMNLRDVGRTRAVEKDEE